MAKSQPQMTEINLKGGTKIHVLPGKQIWISVEAAAWSYAGYVCNGYLNFTPVDATWSKGGYAVSRAVLKFARRLGIKKLRLELVSNVRNPRGWVQKIRYGYIQRSKFTRLLGVRKTVQGNHGKMLLLLEKDLQIKGA